MPSKRQPSTIRLDPADWNTARLLVSARGRYDLSELIRDLIREAAKGPSAPKIPASITGLAERLDVSVDGALTVAGELLGALTPEDVDALDRHATALGVPPAGSYRRSPRCGLTSSAS